MTPPLTRRPRVGFVWHQLPSYAACAIRAVIRADVADIRVIATRSAVSTAPCDEVLGPVLRWYSEDDRPRWDEAAGWIPDLAIVTGWAFPFCRHLAAQARRRHARVVAMIDNRYRGDLRQAIGAVVFRGVIRRGLAAAWVPGRSGTRLLRFLGMPTERIFTRLYGCDPALFGGSVPLMERPKRILFVGQLIHRKGVDTLIDGFARSSLPASGWQLHIHGAGPLESLVSTRPQVTHHGYGTPATIAAALQAARICVLPSRDDNWGVALHEAATAGCMLVTTTAVGAHEDLVTTRNGLVIPPGDPRRLALALDAAATQVADQGGAVFAESTRLAAAFGPAPFAEAFREICGRVLPPAFPQDSPP